MLFIGTQFNIRSLLTLRVCVRSSVLQRYDLKALLSKVKRDLVYRKRDLSKGVCPQFGGTTLRPQGTTLTNVCVANTTNVRVVKTILSKVL